MEQFLLNQLFSMTLAATVQRSPTYQKHVSETEKTAFRFALKKALEDLSAQYRHTVSEDVHCKNIQKLSDDITAKYGKVLYGRQFRIGSAQKSLNLYLKYLWCIGRIVTPPHCPIDSIVLDGIGYKNAKWTRLNSLDEYKEIIHNAKVAAGTQSLSDWELEHYNNSSANC